MPDAVIVVTDAAGSEVARGVTGVHGTLVLEVPIGEFIKLALDANTAACVMGYS